MPTVRHITALIAATFITTVAGAQVLDEVVVSGKRLRELRAEVIKAEDRVVARYNELNQDDDLDIECHSFTPTGSRLSHRYCLLKLQKRAQEIENETLFSFGADVVGAWFKAERLPKTAALFAAVRDDFIPVNRASKALWPRRRPPYADARVKPCVEFSDSGSYPSGHGIQSALWATLLGELLPDHADRFQTRALETRRMKMFTGVHYPSDLEAGRIVGEALAREMLKSPALQPALVEARAEIEAARSSP